MALSSRIALITVVVVTLANIAYFGRDMFGQPAAHAPPDGSAAKYGFYMHVFSEPAAVIDQVRQIKSFFPGSPIYMMSDGGLRFDELCRLEGCTFVLCPPANDRWHPWPFARRLLDAALALGTEYVVLLEPDVTIHGPITRAPDRDAGGIDVPQRSLGDLWNADVVKYVEALARETKPGFKWDRRSMKTGLAGGSYFRTEVILDAFSDEAVARLDWNRLGMVSKVVFSSDIAMPFLLAARGWDLQPWPDVAQMEESEAIRGGGASDAVFRHYSRGYPGGKPAYRRAATEADKRLFKDRIAAHIRTSCNCQMCYNRSQYVELWGSTRCTSRLPFEYSERLQRRYFPKGRHT